MDSAMKPSVLFVYFTYTNQTRKVIDAMAEVLRGHDVDVTLAAIEFTDPRYAARFKEFPMPHPFRELVGMIPAESPRRHPAKIAIPDVVTEREYDLVVIGSPTWWLSTDVPVRSFLESGTASRVLKGKLSPPPSAAAGTGNTTSRQSAGSAPNTAASSPTASTSATREARSAPCCRC
jgi:flavodoxin